MRPLSVGEILDASFSAFRRNFGQLCLAVLAIVVPTALLQTLVFASVADLEYEFGTATFDESSGATGAEAAGILVVTLLLVVNGILAPAACLRLIGGDILGQSVRAGESLRFALRKLPRLFWVLILYTLSLLLGFLLCILPGVWAYVLFGLAVPAALYENAKGVPAMKRSRFLVTDNWWRSFAVLGVMALIVSVVQNVLSVAVVGGILVDSDNDVLNAVLFTVTTAIGFMIALPLQAAATAILYFDLRVRKEGFDLQLLADRMAAAAPAPAVAGLPPADAPPSSGSFLPPRPPDG